MASRRAPDQPDADEFPASWPSLLRGLQRAERLGGKRAMGPERAPSGLVVGHFTDPEGNLIGVAGTA